MDHDPFDTDDTPRDARSVSGEDMRWLMSSQQGRRIVWRLLERAGIYRTSFSGDANRTFFNEGARNVGLSLVADIHANAPEMYALMTQEAKTPHE
jgi:hypothetical protein